MKVIQEVGRSEFGINVQWYFKILILTKKKLESGREDGFRNWCGKPFVGIWIKGYLY